MVEVGDIIISENKDLKLTNVYFLSFNSNTKFYEFRCLTCGDMVFHVENKSELNIEKLNYYIPDIKYVIKKEDIVDFLNNNYKLNYPIKIHNSLMEGAYNEM